MWLASALVVVGFSLSQRRQLGVVNEEPCKASCDAGRDDECDEPGPHGGFDSGEGQSCDRHPTTSCDRACTFPPPSPRPPWLDGAGTYPAPPPSAPPVDYAYVGVAALLVALALCVLCVACALARARRRGGHSTSALCWAYYCCCLIPFVGPVLGGEQLRPPPWDPARELAEARARDRARRKAAEPEGDEGTLRGVEKPVVTLSLSSL